MSVYLMATILSIILVICGLVIVVTRSRSTRYRERYDYDGDEAEASSPPSSSIPPLINEGGFQYDVFLSFRGPDTRISFTNDLYRALEDKGIITFIDSAKLETGQKVDELFECIRKSEIFVPIFSKGYADSKWCLKEIAEIVECKRLECNRRIIPVFFDVEPRHVRNQTGPFAHAFQSYVNSDKIDEKVVNKWRNALREAGEISGYESAKFETKAKLIRLIVDRISTKVNTGPLFIAKHPVGLQSRIESVLKMLDLDSQGSPRVVVIHGMGGIGKTTLAKALYNQIFSDFDCYSFLSDINEAAKHSNDGLVSLQTQLLEDVFKGAKVNIRSTDAGIGQIKRRMRSTKVLLVLDNVGNSSQLDTLVGDVDWFRSGSRIIITSRDPCVLRKTERVNLYELKVLDVTQSFQLFNWHAFGAEQPDREFVELSKKAASIAGGLPLALEVFGSQFWNKKTVEQWESMLKKLKEVQHKDIYEKLKISYDELDLNEKKVFLDIACFFIRQGRENASIMWESCTYFPSETIETLMSKCLLSIDDQTREFQMHDLIQDMGKKIVDDEHLLNPGMCKSRLWREEEILDALQNKRGMKNIEVIQRFESKDLMSIETKSFSAMSQLRMLRLHNVLLKGKYEDFPKTLRWFDWHIPRNYSLPLDLHQENIFVFNSSSSLPAKIWDQRRSTWVKDRNELRVLELKGWELPSSPDFSDFPCLVKFTLIDCHSLVKVGKSIGHLGHLTCLRLAGCSTLQSLPASISSLGSLKILDLSRCSSLSHLPDEVGNLRSLLGLLLSQTALCSLPANISSLGSLKILDLSWCSSLLHLPDEVGNLQSLTELLLLGTALRSFPASISSLGSLKILCLWECSSLSYLPNEIGNLWSLVELLLSGTAIQLIPDSIYQLKNLEKLQLDQCKSLTTLPESIGGLESLKELKLDSSSINRIPDSLGDLKQLRTLEANECNSLATLPTSIGKASSLTHLFLEGTRIEELPDAIGELENLSYCLVSRCKRLPAPMSKRRKLDHLMMRNNGLRKLLYKAPSLTHMFLDGTNIGEIPHSDLEYLSQRSMTSDKCRKGKIRKVTYMRGTNDGWQEASDGASIVTQLHLDGAMIADLPDSVGELVGCKYLKRLPVSVSKLRNLRYLQINDAGARELPDDFGSLCSLTMLHMVGCREIKKLPESIVDLRMLSYMDLTNSSNLTLIPGLRDLSQLKELNLWGCENLIMLPLLPSCLIRLFCDGCTALQRLDVSNLKNLTDLCLAGCTSLTEIDGMNILEALRCLHMSGCKSLSNASKNQLVQEIFERLEIFSITGRAIPRLFTDRQLSYEVPLSLDLDVREGVDLLVCLVVSFEKPTVNWRPILTMENGKIGTATAWLPLLKLTTYSNEDILCLWRFKCSWLFPLGKVKITLERRGWKGAEVRSGGLCEPTKEVEICEDGQEFSAFESIARCCRTTNLV